MNQYAFERERPIVDTKYGKLCGVTYGNVNIFMGVEYAKAKRFHMPEELEPWEGVKNAYQHGPVAVQLSPANPFSYYRGLHVLEKESEDCQNVNIWAPRAHEGEKSLYLCGFMAAASLAETRLRRSRLTALTWRTMAMWSLSPSITG